jgi:transposase-like protein
MSRGTRFPAEFKDEAVGLYRSSGQSLREIAEELGIAPETLRRCVVRVEIDAGDRQGLDGPHRNPARHCGPFAHCGPNLEGAADRVQAVGHALQSRCRSPSTRCVEPAAVVFYLESELAADLRQAEDNV